MLNGIRIIAERVCVRERKRSSSDTGIYHESVFSCLSREVKRLEWKVEKLKRRLCTVFLNTLPKKRRKSELIKTPPCFQHEGIRAELMQKYSILQQRGTNLLINLLINLFINPQSALCIIYSKANVSLFFLLQSRKKWNPFSSLLVVHVSHTHSQIIVTFN